VPTGLEMRRPRPYEENYIAENPLGISSERNRESIKMTQDEIDTSLVDKYSHKNIEKDAEEKYQAYLEKLPPEDKAVVEAGKNYYTLTF
jgi:hypothetical protein